MMECIQNEKEVIDEMHNLNKTIEIQNKKIMQLERELELSKQSESDIEPMKEKLKLLDLEYKTFIQQTQSELNQSLTDKMEVEKREQLLIATMNNITASQSVLETNNMDKHGEIITQYELMLEKESSESNATITHLYSKTKDLQAKYTKDMQQAKQLINQLKHDSAMHKMVLDDKKKELEEKKRDVEDKKRENDLSNMQKTSILSENSALKEKLSALEHKNLSMERQLSVAEKQMTDLNNKIYLDQQTSISQMRFQHEMEEMKLKSALKEASHEAEKLSDRNMKEHAHTSSENDINEARLVLLHNQNSEILLLQNKLEEAALNIDRLKSILVENRFELENKNRLLFKIETETSKRFQQENRKQSDDHSHQSQNIMKQHRLKVPNESKSMIYVTSHSVLPPPPPHNVNQLESEVQRLNLLLSSNRVQSLEDQVRLFSANCLLIAYLLIICCVFVGWGVTDPRRKAN